MASGRFAYRLVFFNADEMVVSWYCPFEVGFPGGLRLRVGLWFCRDLVRELWLLLLLVFLVIFLIYNIVTRVKQCATVPKLIDRPCFALLLQLQVEALVESNEENGSNISDF